MKHFYLFVLVVLLLPTISRAETLAPQFINLQAVLVDDGGNVLHDKQQADISFAVIGVDGKPIYVKGSSLDGLLPKSFYTS